MKYDVKVRVFTVGVIRVEAEDGRDAIVEVDDIFNPAMKTNGLSLEVLHIEPIAEEEPLLEDQPPDFTDRGMSKDDYMESDIDFQDPQWDQGNRYHGA